VVWSRLRRLVRREEKKHYHNWSISDEKVIARCERCKRPTSFTYLKRCDCGEERSLTRRWGWLTRSFPSAPRRAKEDYLCSDCFRERITSIASRIKKAVEVQDILFVEEHQMPYGYPDWRRASFDWDELRRLGLVTMYDVDEEGLRRLLAREAVILVATQSEEHYRIYNLWLMVRCHRMGVYMIAVLKGDYMC